MPAVSYPANEPARPYDMVFIAGPRIDISRMKKAYEEHQKAGRHCVIIGNGEKSIKDEDMDLLKDRLAPDVRIDILMHGRIENKTHRMQVKHKDEAYLIPIAPPLGLVAKLKKLFHFGKSEEYIKSPIGMDTAEIFDKIKSCAGDKADGMQVHLWSCSGGGAAKDIEHLPEKAVLITHAAKVSILQVTTNDTMTASMNRHPISIYKEFAHNITKTAQNATITSHSNGHIFKHKAKAPKDPITSPEELERYLKHSLASYEKALDKAGIEKNARGEVGGSSFKQDDLKRYSQEACFIEALNGNVKYLDSYIDKTHEHPDDLSLAHRFSVIHVASASDQPIKMVSSILKKGGNINQQDGYGSAILHRAATRGDMKMTRFLLEKGASVDLQDSWGNNALHTATTRGDMKMASFLLEKGASVDLPDKRGYTALHKAAIRSNTEMTSLLVEKGANINLPDKEGNTALHKATAWSDMRMASLLLEKGAHVDFPDKEGKTALHKAVDRGDMQMASLLLEKGAHVDLADKNGKTALHLAADKGNQQMVSFLVKQLVNIDSPDKQVNADQLKVPERAEQEAMLIRHADEKLLETPQSPRAKAKPLVSAELTTISKNLAVTGMKHEQTSAAQSHVSTLEQSRAKPKGNGNER